tara:strand:+ start:961 stop:1290 length:330 start_codon:yes stop_codon:yes gene_type:complete
MEKILGKRVTPEELAEYLGVNVKTVRQHYQKLGGLRLGKRYIFFERRILDAISTEKWEMESPGQEDLWESTTEEGKNLEDQERGNRMGGRNEGRRSTNLAREDRHNLLD